MRQWLAALALAAVLAVTGCQGEGPGPEAGGRGAPAPAGRSAPAATRPFCTDRSTKAVVRGFLAAMAAGRVRELDGFFAPAPQFKWYANSVPPGVREGDRAMDRGSLLDCDTHKLVVLAIGEAY
jgi:hypothetical protein